MIEEPLQTAEVSNGKLFRAAFDSAAMGMAIVSLQGRWLQVNRALCEITGYPAVELLGMSFQDITHPEDLERDLAFLPCLISGKSPSYEVEKRYIHKSGHCVWIQVGASLVRDAQNAPLCFSAQFVDISARKRTEQALQDSEAELRALFASMDDLVFVFDSDGRYLQIMTTNRLNLYRPPAERIGKTVHEVLPEKTANPILAHIRQALREKRTVHCEYSLPINGTEHWFSGASSPISEDRVIWVARDISERKWSEKALEAANGQLTQWLGQLEERNQEISLLSQLGELLQSCLTVAEFYQVIECSMPQLFPDASGSVYLLNDSRKTVEAVSTWGHAAEAEPVFAPEDCWALRMGRAHRGDRAHLICRHRRPQMLPSLCIPLIAQGESIGVLSLQEARDLRRDGKAPQQTSRMQLATAVAERIGLSFANLSLRETLRRSAVSQVSPVARLGDLAV